MGLLSSCCCCCSVRKGSFVSGCYTILYFFAFAVLTGNIAYLEIRTWLGAKAGEDTGGGRTTVGGVTRSDVTEANADQGHSNGDAPEAKFAPSQSPPLSIVVILVDFACELSGFVASIVLLCGLIQEKKALLIPWMVIVPAHTALDVYTSSDILIAFFESTGTQDEDSEHESWRTMILLTAVGITAVINIYALLCVYSQYEDYKAGRGTAASEDMDLENVGPGRSRWLEGRGAGRDELYTTFKTRKHNNSVNADGVKYLSAQAQEETLSYKDDSEKMPTIQFYEESSNSSPESTNAQSKLLNKNSAQKTSDAAMTNNVSISPSSAQKNNCDSGSPHHTVLEEQSTTADFINDL